VKPSNVLLLPDWLPEPNGWMDRWERLHGCRRVQQHEVQRPLRGDWIMRLEESLLDMDEPAVLVGQGLGCHLVAAWASHSRQVQRVSAAMLVAPNDPTSVEVAGALHSWTRVPAAPLPIPSMVVIDSLASAGAAVKTRDFATGWGSRLVECKDRSGDWPAGYRLLQELAAHRLSHPLKEI
jgi:uncharacterized protein